MFVVLTSIGVVVERADPGILVIAGAFVEQKFAIGVPTGQFSATVQVEVLDRERAGDVSGGESPRERNLNVLIVTLVLVDADPDPNIATDDYLFLLVLIKVAELRILDSAGRCVHYYESGREGVRCDCLPDLEAALPKTADHVAQAVAICVADVEYSTGHH